MGRKIDMGITTEYNYCFGEYKTLKTNMCYAEDGMVVFKHILHLDEDDIKEAFDKLGKDN